MKFVGYEFSDHALNTHARMKRKCDHANQHVHKLEIGAVSESMMQMTPAEI